MSWLCLRTASVLPGAPLTVRRCGVALPDELFHPQNISAWGSLFPPLIFQPIFFKGCLPQLQAVPPLPRQCPVNTTAPASLPVPTGRAWAPLCPCAASGRGCPQKTWGRFWRRCVFPAGCKWPRGSEQRAGSLASSGAAGVVLALSAIACISKVLEQKAEAGAGGFQSTGGKLQ